MRHLTPLEARKFLKQRPGVVLIENRYAWRTIA